MPKRYVRKKINEVGRRKKKKKKIEFLKKSKGDEGKKGIGRV